MSGSDNVKSYDEMAKDIEDTLKKHSEEIFLECQHFCESIGVEINLPEGFIPPSGLRLDYVIYVKSGEDGEQTKKNVAVVATLLSLLGIGKVTVACPGQTYGTHLSFMASNFGRKYLSDSLSLIEIENFDTLTFKKEPPKINDLRIWVEDNDGERTSNLIRSFLTSNGYDVEHWGPVVHGCGTCWRFWVPELLPLTTISLTEHILMC